MCLPFVSTREHTSYSHKYNPEEINTRWLKTQLSLDPDTPHPFSEMKERGSQLQKLKPQEKKKIIKIFPHDNAKLDHDPIDFRTPTKVMTRASAKHSPSPTISPSTEAVLLHKVPKFLQILYQMLQRESDDIIAWSNEGQAFQVKDIKRLEATVLPKYFKHQKMSSFQRQLNYFSFRKLTKSKSKTDGGVNTCTFRHPYFCEHEPEKLNLITKKNGPSTALFSPETTTSGGGDAKDVKKTPSLKQNRLKLSRKSLILPRKTSTSSSTSSSSSRSGTDPMMIQGKENQSPQIIEQEAQDYSGFYHMNSLFTSENQMIPFDLTQHLPDESPWPSPQDHQPHLQPPLVLPSRPQNMNGDFFMLQQISNQVVSPRQHPSSSSSGTTFWSDALLDFDLSLNAADFL